MLTDKQIETLIREFRTDETDSVVMFNFARALLDAHNAGAQEPVAEVIREYFAGRDHWDFKVLDKTLAHGTKLYAHPQPMRQTDAAQAICEEYEAAFENMLGCFGSEVDEYIQRVHAEIERLDRAKGE